MPETHSEQSRKHSGLLLFAGVAGVVSSLTLVAVLIWRQDAAMLLAKSALDQRVREGRSVRVIPAAKASEVRPVVLTGEARPYANVTLYAKISGYLKEIKVDKGDEVAPDQLIAVIESPELNRQYAAAQADARNKRLDAKRAAYLMASGSISAQSAETIETTAKVAEENAAALKAQKDYEVLRAPFAGTITARYADPGALVQNAATSQTNALPLVALSDTKRLRVYIYPDQKTASSVRVGDPVEVADVARPDSRISATVTRTSGELDPKTRTLLVEIDVDNRDGRFLAGSFVQVTLFIRSPGSVEIPAASLVIQGNKTMVAIVTKDDRVTLRDVNIVESDGRIVRILSGLTEGEHVIVNPGGSIEEGEKVRPIVVGSAKSPPR